MPKITLFDSGVGITGSGGFIGAHLAASLGRRSAAHSYDVDVCSAEELGIVGRRMPLHSLVHLAAAGTVITEIAAVPRMFEVSVGGALNALNAFQPRRVVYSSSCSVYGNASPLGGAPTWEDAHPISIYGLSKVTTEKLFEQWARKTGSTAMILRLGNVVGSGCAGLIPYLVRHAARYPDGGVPAEMRGGGRICRDYVPVDYVVRTTQAALEMKLKPGSCPIYNVGSGRTLSNGDIAAILKEWLIDRGYVLNVVFQPAPEAGEAIFSGLQTASAENAFGLKPPSPEEVREAVLDAARSCLSRISQENPISRSVLV